MKKIISLILLLAFILIIIPIGNNTVSALSWYNNSWSYSKKITIEHTKVLATLTNFPILFDNISSSFSNAQSNGNDFVFTSKDNLTKYNHQIESFSGNRLIAWVNITSLSSVVDTVIYLYYGNPSCSNQQNMYGTWNSNYKAVYHHNESASLFDSTINMNKAVKQANTVSTYTSGKIGNSLDYENSGYFVTPVNMLGTYISFFSVEFWFNPDTITSDDGLFARASPSVSSPSFSIYSSNTYIRTLIGGTTYSKDTIALTLGIWQNFAITYSDTDDTVRYYLNGKEVSNEVTVGGTFYVDCPFWIGRYMGVTHVYDGKIDEFRFSISSRNASWVNTSYLNQNSPSTFLSVASQFTAHVYPSTPIYFESLSYNSTCIKLNWTKATNTDKIVIIAKLNSYPTLGIDSPIYNNSGLNYNHTGLINNSHWFYRCYSWNSSGLGTISISYIRGHDTTIGNTSKALNLYLFENIINATGFHNYTLNSTGYKVYANYTGNESSFNSTSLNSSGSNWLYLGSTVTFDSGQFFLLILIGLWTYFIYLFYKEKEVIFSFAIICCGLPLAIILSGVAYYNSYPFGYLISFIIVLISFLIPSYAMYQKNKKKKK